jgi:hypothetical protein
MAEWSENNMKQKTNSVDFSPQAKYTDWATAAFGEISGNFWG